MALQQPITAMLQDFARGDKDACDRLMPLVYSELHAIANRHINREHGPQTLQPTALVHEAYLRLIGSNQPDYNCRAHFLGIAARLMRQILIDYARSRKASKRGGGQRNQSLEAWMEFPVEEPGSSLQVDDALSALEQTDPAKARLIELRFFGGLTAEESAELLGIPVEKVRADLRVAQAWLRRELNRAS